MCAIASFVESGYGWEIRNGPRSGALPGNSTWECALHEAATLACLALALRGGNAAEMRVVTLPCFE